MKDLISRLLQSSHIDPVYFVTAVLDITAYFLWRGLKRGTPPMQSALYKAVILLAILLTAGTLARLFGLITDWKELESIWKF